MQIKKRQHDTTTAFEKRHGSRMVGDKLIGVTSANGTLKIQFSPYPYIKINIVYKAITSKTGGTLKHNMVKLKEEIFETLKNNGFNIQQEKKGIKTPK